MSSIQIKPCQCRVCLELIKGEFLRGTLEAVRRELRGDYLQPQVRKPRPLRLTYRLGSRFSASGIVH